MNFNCVLVSDFDGTITRKDFYRLAVERFLTPTDIAPWEEYRSGKITHFQSLQQIFRRIHRPLAEVLALIEDMKIDPDLPKSVDALNNAGWEVVISSAGCEWYVKILLEGLGVDIPLYANPGDYPEGGPLEMREPLDSPFYSPETGIDKAGIVRHHLKQGQTVAYAGDGFADLDASLLVPDDLRFARADLAKTLEKQGIPFQPFEIWSEIAKKILGKS